VNLLSAAERLAAMDRSTVQFDASRCLYTHDRYSTCAACFDICPVEAIQPGSPPLFDVNKCETCLACLPSCPMGAFQAEDSVAALLTCSTRMETKNIELVCNKHKNAEMGEQDSTAVRIKGCLAGLGSGAYLMLVALGVENILVRLDACAECEWMDLGKRVELQVTQAKQILEISDKAECVSYVTESVQTMQRPLWDAYNPPLSRRDLFRMVAQQGKVAMARAMEETDTNQAKMMGYNRRRLLGAIDHLPVNQDFLPISLIDFDFAIVSASDECTACGTCANTCPTHALSLKKHDDNSSYTLMFSPQNCIGCEACEHVCAPAAITIDHAPLSDLIFGRMETRVIRTGKLRRCNRCHTLMADRNGEELCALCEYRSKHPFGSMVPPGMKVLERLEDKKSAS
jgi:ferredoxin